MAEDDKSFVSRWSRLKRAREEEALSDLAPAEAPLAEAGQEPAAAGEVDVEELVKSLPDIETMTVDSDFTVFLQKGVPQELKQRALRRLWRLNPVFANLDGLAEYDEDFTDAALAVKTVKTLYEVGKGMPGPKKPDEEDAETASDADREPDPEAPGSAEAELGDEEAEEAEGQPEAGETAALTDAGEEMDQAAALASESRTGEPAPSPAPRRGRAAQRRWGAREG